MPRCPSVVLLGYNTPGYGSNASIPFLFVHVSRARVPRRVARIGRHVGGNDDRVVADHWLIDAEPKGIKVVKMYHMRRTCALIDNSC